MAETESQQPETAQDAYKMLLRKHIAPELRTLGFKGSGSSFSVGRGDYRVGIKFQKNKWSTRDSVTFDVNLSVWHPANNELFAKENVIARRRGKDTEVPSSGNFFTRLSKLGEPKADFPWTVTSAGPNNEVARDVLEAIGVSFLPRVEEELRRPLGVPTPAAERPDRISQDEKNEAAWTWHKEALERGGIRNLHRIDSDPKPD